MYKQFYEDIIREHLCEVIENVSNLMQDMERKVRTAAVKAINVILELVSAFKIIIHTKLLFSLSFIDT